MNRTKYHRRLARRLTPRLEDLRDQLYGACARTDRARDAYEQARRAAFCACAACSAAQRAASFARRRYLAIRADETRDAWELCRSTEASIARETHALENVLAFAEDVVRYARRRGAAPQACAAGF